MIISIPQQALRDLYGFLQTPGWCEDITDVYLGGQILAEVLPKLDLSWLVSPDVLQQMEPELAKTYVDRAEKWQYTLVTLEITDAQRDKIRKAISSSVKGKHFQINPFTYALLGALDYKQ
jgi:hypothetical protein